MNLQLIETLLLNLQKDSTFAAYSSILFVIMFVVLFATGPGSIPWFLVSELFNQSARPVATSVAIGVNWTANFLVSFGFKPLQTALDSNVFYIFAVLQALFTLYIYRKVPETKNKSIEEISSMFRQISYQWDGNIQILVLFLVKEAARWQNKSSCLATSALLSGQVLIVNISLNWCCTEIIAKKRNAHWPAFFSLIKK